MTQEVLLKEGMPSKKAKIVLINGSLHGDSENSNTLSLLQVAETELFKRGAKVTLISPELTEFRAEKSTENRSMYVLRTQQILSALKIADGLIVGTGTYWGHSGSVLQRFIEETTPTEGTGVWLGKPIGIVVSEHSTGGQAVLANLMLTFSNLGCLIPPQAGMVFSRLGQEAKKHGAEWARDIWGLDDVGSICDKVMAYASQRNAVKTQSWPMDSDPDSFHRRWIEPPARS
ncbi:MAG: NAD(P)H-dependent oxidoreductase, partial [Verrucomicrobia bacterium]|nr:NAD(P)H-dependent oxidoreductase [Verrucomicrobiota bacterium]